MAKPPGKCIFCGGGDMTKEHIWPDWLEPYVPQTHTHRGFERVTLHAPDKEPETTREIRRGDIHTAKLRIVCRGCNNGWMSRLQETAKPVLLPMISGRRTRLLKNHKTLLARWAAMGVMVASHSMGRYNAITQAERTALKDSDRPPSNWKIWIGYYPSDAWRGKLVHATMPMALREEDLPKPDDAGMRPPNTQSTAYVVGQLYLYVLSSTLVQLVRGFKLGPRSTPTLRQIWPITSRAIVFPPTPMTDQDAKAMASALSRYASDRRIVLK